MRINKYLNKISIAALLIEVAIVACNEKTLVDVAPEELEPVVSSFVPLTVAIGELVTVTGENLNYAEKAFVGDQKVPIKYKTNDSYLVIEITSDVHGGTIRIENESGIGTASSESLTISFNEPALTDVPPGGKINEEVMISGLNLQYIKKLMVGDVEADIVSQSPSELVFKVPFLLEDLTTLSYDYASASGDQTVYLTENGFGVMKSWPSFTTVPGEAMINTEITIIGENMNVVDSVYLGTSKIEITSQDALTLVFTVPNDTTLEGYQSINLYSYGGQELSSGPVFRVITKLEKMLENFESYEGDPFVMKKTILPTYLSGLNGNSLILAKEGSFYAHMEIDYDQSQYNNSGSTYSEFYFTGEDNLINLSEFDDPWVHMWINTNNTSPYFVFYSDLSTSVDAVDKDRGTHYVKRFNSADYGDDWQLFAWRMKDLKFRSGGSADPYSSDVFSIYNLKTFRIQFRTSSDIPLEKSEFNFDSFMVVNGKMKGANDVTFLGNEE